MAPKPAGKKVASKAVTKKGGKKKGVESWKIYIYKVRNSAPPVRPCDPACAGSLSPSVVMHCSSQIMLSRRS